ncbi:virulence factor SrfC family protein [Pseudomonas sp. DG56-2]|uniref:virulence factor SrfC family protein n=1 Tax=Pseudomonas sp. DG56-2 TaxID=2320270 RepID=UPI0010A647E5|nr:virulence factor SrfC family protein [Pseudomonas sp. DG56-2]
MSKLTPKQQQLTGAWGAVHKGAGEALTWIEQVRGNAASVEAEADGLSLRLHRARNLAKNLQQAAETPMVIGFFGMSQAGKSYLISSLAADTEGNLTTDFAGEPFNFLEHVNPPGSGKEATGVVTRFSSSAQPSPDANYPVELKLFSEIEVAKMLANTWFEDFNQDKFDYEFDEQRIQSALSGFEGRETENLQPGVSADDVVALWDYLNGNYEKAVRKLGETYWPRVLKLAPRLNYRQRAKLFSILWGEQSLLTEVYEQLVGALHKLGHPQTVFAPVSALVEKVDGTYLQVQNIMNVDTLGRLGTSRDNPITILPMRDGKPQTPVGITIGQLAALTVEMTFRLTNQPQADLLKDADLLDFPGYRTRFQLMKIEEAQGSGIQETNPVSNLLLRGKVAYLFERYSDTQQMNALVMCTSTKVQADVVTIGPVLTRWIQTTQGATPKERSHRAPGLIWALTMLDVFIGTTHDKKKQALPELWQNMMTMTLIERFGNLEWMKDWSGAPFNNTFLVRKPRFACTFIDRDANGDECAFHSEQHVQDLTETFVGHPTVQRHVKDPQEAFAAMLGLNNGGITRFSDNFKNVANIDFKLSRIEEQLHQCRTDLLEHGMHVWREEDFEQLLNKKRQKTQYLLDNLGADPDVIGDLIHALQLPVEQLRELYLGGVYDIDGLDAEAESEPEPAHRAPANKAPALNFGNMFANSQAESAAAAKKPLAQRLTPEQRFARAALKAWIKHMRDVGTRILLLNSLRMSKELVDALTEELISAVRSNAFMAELDLAVSRRAQGGIHRDQLVQRQVLSVQLLMRDFLSWFGLLAKPEAERPNSLLGDRTPVFSFYRSVPAGDLPQLSEQPTHQEQRYQVDWLSGLAWLTQENAKSGADPEITTEQRRQLAVLLNTFEAS